MESRLNKLGPIHFGLEEQHCSSLQVHVEMTLSEWGSGALKKILSTYMTRLQSILRDRPKKWPSHAHILTWKERSQRGRLEYREE